MTSEEAINICMEVRHYLTSGNPIWDKEKVGEALVMAIDALKRERPEFNRAIRGAMASRTYPTEWCEQCTLWEDNKCLGVAHCKSNIEALKHAMSDDLISRAEAIDALRYAQHRFTVADEAGGMGSVKWSEDVIYFAAAERVLTELPPADRPRGEWIPASEKLPDIEQDVLATTTLFGTREVTFAWRINDGEWAIREGSVEAANNDILAWMPLPEPYKESDTK